MARVKIVNTVFRLKRGGKFKLPGIKDEVEFTNGQEFHIVSDLLYMNGFPVPGPMQGPIINWVINNKRLFVEDTRNF
jgi:hypothetical protein